MHLAKNHPSKNVSYALFGELKKWATNCDHFLKRNLKETQITYFSLFLGLVILTAVQKKTILVMKMK